MSLSVLLLLTPFLALDWHQIPGDQCYNCQEKSKGIAEEHEVSVGSLSIRELIRRERSALKIFRLKSCPRCKGDLVLERDQWGWYEQCIQCGYLHDLPEVSLSKTAQNSGWIQHEM